MIIKLEKEVLWESGVSSTKYWIMADGKYIDLAYDEETALEKYENAKVNYVAPYKVTLKEEEI